MSEQLTPQPGDKVLVRFRPREIHAFVDDDGLYAGMDDVEDGRADVEIVERADDPSRDPIGQWRAIHGMHLYRKSRKGDGTVWRDVQTGEEFSDVYVWNLPRVHVAIASVKPGAPLVVQYGDPEPDTRRTYRSPNGVTVQMGTFGWRVVETNGDTLINVPWTAIRAEFFPLTEVVEP